MRVTFKDRLIGFLFVITGIASVFMVGELSILVFCLTIGMGIMFSK